MLKNLIVSFSFAGVGLALYLATANAWKALHTKGWERRINGAYVCARLGFAIMVALITEAVWGAPEVPWTWRAGLYTLAAVMVCLGYLGVAIEQRKARRP